MPRNAKIPSATLPCPQVPFPPTPVFPSSAVPSAGQQPVSPAIEIWLDLIADVMVASVLKEATHE